MLFRSEKVELNMKERPVYPAWKNYLRMAKIVLAEMKKDHVLQSFIRSGVGLEG